MANNSQGIAVVWSGLTLGELVSVSVDGVTADTVEMTDRSVATRDKRYRIADCDYGTVTVRCRGTTGMSTSNVGTSGTLAISRNSTVIFSSTYAIFASLAWSASVGELQEYTVTFKLTE